MVQITCCPPTLIWEDPKSHLICSISLSTHHNHTHLWTLDTTPNNTHHIREWPHTHIKHHICPTLKCNSLIIPRFMMDSPAVTLKENIPHWITFKIKTLSKLRWVTVTPLNRCRKCKRSIRWWSITQWIISLLVLFKKLTSRVWSLIHWSTFTTCTRQQATRLAPAQAADSSPTRSSLSVAENPESTNIFINLTLQWYKISSRGTKGTERVLRREPMKCLSLILLRKKGERRLILRYKISNLYSSD